MKVAVCYEKDLTAEQIVEEALQIWAKVRALTYEPASEQAAAHLRRIHTEHSSFAKSYPIVLQYMVRGRQFRKRAFKRWLRYIVQNPWKDEEQYLEAQGEYVVYLYREENPRAGPDEARSVRENVVNNLKQEHITLKRAAEAAAKDVTVREQRYVEKNAAELRDYYREHGEILVDRIDVLSDVPTGDVPDIDALVNLV